MNRTYGVIKLFQQNVRIIERPVRKDIHFTGLKYAKAAEFVIQFVDIADLLPKIVNGNTACDL